MELKPTTQILASCGGKLLIVPYGIETAFSDEKILVFDAFNRTLWN